MPEVTKTLSNGQEITLAGSLKMRQLREVSRAATAGELEQVYPVYARLIKRWTLLDEETGKELDPTDPDSYDNLTMQQFKAVADGVNEYLSETAEKN